MRPVGAACADAAPKQSGTGSECERGALGASHSVDHLEFVKDRGSYAKRGTL